MLLLNLPAFESKKYAAYDRFTETVRMAKSRPRKDQSERSDLPCHIIIGVISRMDTPKYGETLRDTNR